MLKKIDSKLGHWIILIMLSIIWGSSFMLIKRGLDAFSYEQVATLRIFIAFIFVLKLFITSKLPAEHSLAYFYLEKVIMKLWEFLFPMEQ